MIGVVRIAGGHAVPLLTDEVRIREARSSGGHRGSIEFLCPSPQTTEVLSWLFLSLLSNTMYLVLAPTNSLTEARGTVLVTVGVVGVLGFLALSARELWRTREFVGLPGVR
jgi:hypothetical protein